MRVSGLGGFKARIVWKVTTRETADGRVQEIISVHVVILLVASIYFFPCFPFVSLSV